MTVFRIIYPWHTSIFLMEISFDMEIIDMIFLAWEHLFWVNETFISLIFACEYVWHKHFYHKWFLWENASLQSCPLSLSSSLALALSCSAHVHPQTSIYKHVQRDKQRFLADVFAHPTHIIFVHVGIAIVPVFYFLFSFKTKKQEEKLENL